MSRAVLSLLRSSLRAASGLTNAHNMAPVLACPSSLHGAVSVRWASKSIKKTRAEESSSGTEDEEKLALKMDAIEDKLGLSTRGMLTDRLPVGPEDVPGGEWFTDEFVTSDPEESDGGIPSPAFGDVDLIPPEVLEHVAAPLDFATEVSESSEGDSDYEDAWLTPDERSINARRKQLKKLLEDPLPIPNRPMWEIEATVIQVDNVQKTTPYGREAQYRVLLIAGNGHGAAGYGVGTHKDVDVATKYALRKAMRDMVALGSHNGELYHDLVGKKNNHTVLIRAVSPAKAGSCSQLLQTVFDLMGVEHVSAKIIGGKRRNRHMVVHALFDAFHNHIPPEVSAYNRGLRMQRLGSHRYSPGSVYPMYPKGPRHVSYKKRGGGTVKA